MLNGIAFKGMNTEPWPWDGWKIQCLFSLFPSSVERLTVVSEVTPLTLMKDSGENKEEYVIDHLHKLEIWGNSDVLALVNSPQSV